MLLHTVQSNWKKQAKNDRTDRTMRSLLDVIDITAYEKEEFAEMLKEVLIWIQEIREEFQYE